MILQSRTFMADIFVAPEKKSEKKGVPMNEKHIHALSSFCQNPIGISFAAQEKDEQILLFLRRHFITNTPWVIIGLFLIVLPMLLPFLFTLTGFLLTLPQNLTILFIAFYYLIVFAYLFINFISWFYNIGLITTKRVVDVDFSDLVYHNVAATKLNLIQDVDYTQVGVLPSLFNYGDVFVQTAGDKPNFDFLAVPNPSKAAHIIEDLIGKKPFNP